MLQKVIRVGNSYAVTIPRGFVEEIKLRPGQRVRVEEDLDSETLMITPVDARAPKGNLTPEFLNWLKKFNAKYKDALSLLAKK